MKFIRRSAALFCLLGMSLSLGCSPKATPTQTMPSASPSTSAAAQVVGALAEQIDSLRDQLQRARESQGNTPAGTASPNPTTSSSPSANTPTPDVTPAPSVSSGPAPTPPPGPIAHPCRIAGKDSDKDGFSDSCEDQLAESFAPVIYHSSEEKYFPTNVDKFLPQSILMFQDTECKYKQRILTGANQNTLISQQISSSCENKLPVLANSTRSKDKKRTFYFENLPEEAQAGSKDSKDWITYVHVYPNNLNGATVQYWRFYAYDNGEGHGGDFEGVHVVLDSQFLPVRAGLLADGSLKYTAWAELETEGTDKARLRLYSESGSHEIHTKGDGLKADGCKGIGGFFSCRVSPDKPETHIRQETWKAGTVTWFNGETGPSAGLLNVGERSLPMNGQFFIQYTGLWGSDADWGPAYSGIGMLTNGFLTAWAAGMVNPKREDAFPLTVSP